MSQDQVPQHVMGAIKDGILGAGRPALVVSLDPVSDDPADMTPEETLAYHGIKTAMQLAHKTASDAGWYKDPVTGQDKDRNFGEVLMLMVTELAEALEADRKDLMDDKLPDRPGQEVEFADCIIRILDTAAARGYDVAGAFIAKNRYNKTRADHKLENRAAGGKKY